MMMVDPTYLKREEARHEARREARQGGRRSFDGMGEIIIRSTTDQQINKQTRKKGQAI